MSDFHVKRCFVALPLDDVMAADVRELVRSIDVDGMRDTKLDHLHVTVKFLGDVDDPQIPEVIGAMRQAAEGVGPFELALRRMRYFPSESRARVLALLTDEPNAVLRLHQQLDDAFGAIGFRREGRQYHPHITVGRFKRASRGVPSADSIDVPAVAQSVDRVVLYQSVLERSGPVYVELADVKL